MSLTLCNIRGRNQILWYAEWFSRIVCDFISRAGNVVRGTAYYFIVCTTGVVCPSCPLHHPPSDGFEIHQIKALIQDGHILDALLSLGLVWIFILLFLLDSAHIHLAQMLALVKVFVQRVWRVDRLVFFCSIFASILQDDFRPTWVFWEELHTMLHLRLAMHGWNHLPPLRRRPCHG
jgi:hypothetical protein